MLGKKIYELRKEFNISQEEFAMAINTSRQSISKWELGDSYPEINKLKEIARFFNVSIDYLLDYDIKSTSCEEFLTKLKNSIDNKDFSISVNEIKSYISRFNNNLHLYVYSSTYLLVLELEKDERNLLDLIVSYCKKAISLYNTQDNNDIVLNDIHLFIIQAYILYKKYDLAMEYMNKTKVYDNRALAECNYRLEKYDETSNIVSNSYLSAVSDIISSTHLQIRILLKQHKENEAYELSNWILNLVDSIQNNDDYFLEEKIIYMYLKAICEKVLKINCQNTIKELVNLINYERTAVLNTTGIKFYYGEHHALYSDIKDHKRKIKQEILEDKDEYFDIFNEVFKEVYGGDIYE